MSHLSSGGWIVKDAESSGVQERLDAEFGTGGATIVAIFLGRTGTDARSDAFLASVETSLAPLLADPLVAGTIGYRRPRQDRFISTDGTGTYKVVSAHGDGGRGGRRGPRAQGAHRAGRGGGRSR